mgnify:CR=1 FL=1
MVKGPFNVNSTSVAAWKAMLGSIHDSQSIFNRIDKANKTSAFANLTPTDIAKNDARISRFRLPASESEKNGGDSRDAYWLGAREYSDADLQLLAEKIVEQVRARGPFLSMSEFVNRRLGPVSEEKAQRGALQQAIDNSNLNANLAAGANAGFNIPEPAVANYKYINAKAGAGPSYQGAPGYLSQADLLNVLGNAATSVRGLYWTAVALNALAWLGMAWLVRALALGLGLPPLEAGTREQLEQGEARFSGFPHHASARGRRPVTRTSSRPSAVVSRTSR